jgi:hypothetical protein
VHWRVGSAVDKPIGFVLEQEQEGMQTNDRAVRPTRTRGRPVITGMAAPVRGPGRCRAWQRHETNRLPRHSQLARAYRAGRDGEPGFACVSRV